MKFYPYKKLLKYPHLMPADVKVWEKFIVKNPDIFSQVAYDVKIGKPRDYSDYPDNEIRRDLEYLSRKRIDVVAFKGNEIWIIEIKPSASFSAIGQALGLSLLFSNGVLNRRRVKPVIITNEKIPDIEEICKRLGIIYLLT